MTGSQPRCWQLFAGLVALFLLFGPGWLVVPTAGASVHTHNSQAHGCAPDVPPAVADTIPAQALPGEVLINEAVTLPNSNWNCSEPSTVFSQVNDSWLEIYNPQSQALDLYAAHTILSLDGGSTRIYLPLGTSIAAGGYLVIFPLEKQTMAVPASWNILLSINNIVIDQVALPQLQADQSYARVPDGSTTWLYAGQPSIDASNNSLDQPPTPTPTKAAKATSTPTASKTAAPASSGTQPAWSKLKFPTPPTPALAATAAPETSTPLDPPQTPPNPQSNSLNGWLIALIVLLILGFLGMCVWLKRLFRPS